MQPFYTGDTVQCDGEVGRVISWRYVNKERVYTVRFPDKREGEYRARDMVMVCELVVERKREF